MIAVDDPHRLADVFLVPYLTDTEGRYDPEGEPQIRYYKQKWYAWIGTKYIEYSEDMVRSYVNMACEKEFLRIYEEKLANVKPDSPPPKKMKVTSGLISSVREAVRAKVEVPDYVSVPLWVTGPYAEDDPCNFIPVQNGIIDVRRIGEDGEAELIPHSPNFFAMWSLPMDYDPESTCPQWEAFLRTNLEGDEDKIAMLREWFGYCMVPDPSMQRFLMMEGEGRNGKSVICAALAALLGGGNVSHVTLEAFGERFALGATVGKLANIAAEVGELDRVAEGHLKAFTSGDRMTIDRKNREPINVLPTARLVLATNNRPRFADKSSGIWRRMLLLRLTYQVPDDQRVFGMDRAAHWKPEASGMLNWALMGLVDLKRYGRFTEPADAAEAIEDYRVESNPCREFLKDRFEFTGDLEGNWVVSSEVYDRYRKWCEANGYSPSNSRNLGREVFRIWPKCERRKLGNRGDRFWAYAGLKAVENPEPEFDSTDFQ